MRRRIVLQGAALVGHFGPGGHLRRRAVGHDGRGPVAHVHWAAPRATAGPGRGGCQGFRAAFVLICGLPVSLFVALQVNFLWHFQCFQVDPVESLGVKSDRTEISGRYFNAVSSYDMSDITFIHVI